jgi:hypothetical protein
MAPKGKPAADMTPEERQQRRALIHALKQAGASMKATTQLLSHDGLPICGVDAKELVDTVLGMTAEGDKVAQIFRAEFFL